MFLAIQQTARHKNLVYDQKYLVKVKNDIQLTHTAEIFVKNLYYELDDFKCQKFVLVGLNDKYEEKRGEPSVDYLLILPNEKTAFCSTAGNYQLRDFLQIAMLLN